MAEFNQEAFRRQLQMLERLLRRLAPVVGRYMALLVEAGLARSEALLLVVEMQRTFLIGQTAQRIEGRTE
ncbi:MAG TPA: hypothetical protein DCQ64_21355 [Candidatus Rokubacteria bacterium]|nr:hypothetical protein [Candidatus Rokubacteria bacterium]